MTMSMRGIDVKSGPVTGQTKKTYFSMVVSSFSDRPEGAQGASVSQDPCPVVEYFVIRFTFSWRSSPSRI